VALANSRSKGRKLISETPKTGLALYFHLGRRAPPQNSRCSRPPLPGRSTNEIRLVEFQQDFPRLVPTFVVRKVRSATKICNYAVEGISASLISGGELIQRLLSEGFKRLYQVFLNHGEGPWRRKCLFPPWKGAERLKQFPPRVGASNRGGRACDLLE